MGRDHPLPRRSSLVLPFWSDADKPEDQDVYGQRSDRQVRGAAGSGSEVRADAGGSQLHNLVRLPSTCLFFCSLVGQSR
jgi:hypothetical protein